MRTIQWWTGIAQDTLASHRNRAGCRSIALFIRTLPGEPLHGLEACTQRESAQNVDFMREVAKKSGSIRVNKRECNLAPIPLVACLRHSSSCHVQCLHFKISSSDRCLVTLSSQHSFCSVLTITLLAAIKINYSYLFCLKHYPR